MPLGFTPPNQGVGMSLHKLFYIINHRNQKLMFKNRKELFSKFEFSSLLKFNK
jgi:hypothetical protein